MKVTRLLLSLVVVSALAGVAWVSQQTEPAGHKMAGAAEKFLEGLSAEQKAKAVYAFDDKERLNWHFVPLQDSAKKSTRKGLPLEEMTKEQRQAALALLKAGTSAEGYTQATTIMSLESLLADLEKSGAMVRNPDWYFFTIFGTPSKTDRWGWRVEGHHLSLNFTMDKGKVVSATPALFGANPAVVRDGPRKGQKTLAEVDDLARTLYRSLDDGQKKVALQKEAFREIEGRTTAPTVGEPRGLAAGKMTADQKATLEKLLNTYAHRMATDVADRELTRVREAGLDKVHFAYNGGLEAGQPRTYRVQGPTFVIEFLNAQADSAKNPANHIHSAWRSLPSDFGLASK